ncbi:MAG: hypothetical protein OXN83_03565 [Oligoflexia bacterium]|nr:hypothetical protein [Oligoflexia bacterium]
MKFIAVLVFLFILPHCVSIKEQTNKKIKQKVILKKRKAKVALIQTNNIPNTNTLEKRKSKTTLKKRLLAKEKFLSQDYYKAKNSKEELEIEFKKHLEYLKKTCEEKEDKKEFLQKQLNSFDDFLKTSLTDPNMDYSLQLLFSDITSLLEEINYNNSIELGIFTLSYRRWYNLPEDIEVKDYPDNWAKMIAQSIECAQ